MVTQTPPQAGALFRATAPDRLPEAAESYLAEHHGSRHTALLMADYRISGLWPVLRDHERAAGPIADDGASVRAFASQRVVRERLGDGIRLHLPLSAWGERIGVLLVDLSGPPDDAHAAALALVADELAVALRAGDRDTDRYRRARRRERLTMAAEMQWDLLPGRSLAHETYLLAGQLEPAYTVCGDHYDWALNGDRLTLSVLNGDGTGMAAALLTTLAVNAIRNARRSGGGLVEQAELAAQAVYAEYGGDRHAATLLLEADLCSGIVYAIDAGSPRALLVRGTDISMLAFQQQLPLGMFGDGHYELEQFRLVPGDRLFIVSDGVHAATPGGRSPYGEQALLSAVRNTRLQPATGAVGTVMRGLHEYHNGTDPEDDAVIVCLDWRGRPNAQADV